MPSAVTQQEEAPANPAQRTPITNDVVIKVATANGSGSQSANLILLRSIFGMGVPVAGKNLFPSNIEGLPAWFIIRANQDGWLAQRPDTDLMIAMNPDTFEDDVAELRPGAMLIMNSSMQSRLKRDDLVVYSVPFSKIVVDICPVTQLRKKIVNVMYVGVAARLLGIEMEEVLRAIDQQFGSKPKAAKMNIDAAQTGYDWALENLPEQDQFRIERAQGTTGKIIIEGNEATAMGMLFGGATVAAWYPITPSSSVCEYLTEYMEKYRREPDGRATYAIVQAEDEIASIGIVLGASWVGARAFTATSGPGISLMSEMAGLSYFAEIPAVIVDVQRMGPSTGLPTRTSQGDILSAYHLSHGDTNHVLLLPGSMEECYEFGMMAFELAEQLQTLVFLMTDLDLGMNKWMCDPFQPPQKPIKRGKVLTAEQLERGNGFQRYGDVDGDGIGYRTLPGTKHAKAAYFTRGTGHTATAAYSEKAVDWKANMDRLARKFDTARTLVPEPIINATAKTPIGIIAYGSSDPAIQEARHHLMTRHELVTNYLRLRALPLTKHVREFIERHETIFVVDQNRDSQMAAIIRAEHPDLASKIISIRHYNGLPIHAGTVVEQIMSSGVLASGKKD